MKCASDYRITLTSKLWLLRYKCSTVHTLARLVKITLILLYQECRKALTNTCLQCQHLFQRIDLLPQPLELWHHILLLCSCTRRRQLRKKNTHAGQIKPWFDRIYTITSRLARWNSLAGARRTAVADVEQGEAEDEEDREGQACHVCGQRTGHSGPRCAAVKGT